MADLIVNHVSSRSPQFEDFRQTRRRIGLRGPVSDLRSRISQRSIGEAICSRSIARVRGCRSRRVRLDDGTERLLWTTFTPEQIDIDVRSSAGRAYLDQILSEFQAAGIRAIRLDAAGYAIKKPGTSCFMIPETFDFIDELTAQAHALNIEVLVEIHAYHRDQIDIAKQVDWVYDFALPPLVLHALYTRNDRASETLAGHQSPELHYGSRYPRRHRRHRRWAGSQRR